ncbi:MAG: hypothetical protein OXD30_08155 [Bryobacterales bacterium]|nr:hypothetical protein [Bryobacterales bacterium]
MEKGLTKQVPLGRQSHLGRRGALAERAPAGPGGTAESAAARSQSAPSMGAPLYQKRIDNSGVRYRHDPRDREIWKFALSAGLFLLLLALLIWGPQGLVTRSSYRQEALRQTVEQLQAVRDELKMQRGRLEDLRRVAALAEAMGLQQTEPDSYSWFAMQPASEESDGVVARLLRAAD